MCRQDDRNDCSSSFQGTKGVLTVVLEQMLLQRRQAQRLGWFASSFCSKSGRFVLKCMATPATKKRAIKLALATASIWRLHPEQKRRIGCRLYLVRAKEWQRHKVMSFFTSSRSWNIARAASSPWRPTMTKQKRELWLPRSSPLSHPL